MTSLNRQLATRSRVRADAAFQRVEAAANAVDRLAGSVWGQLLRLIRERPHWSQAQHEAQRLLARLGPLLAVEIGRRLHGQALWAQRAAAADLERTLPERVLMRAVAQKGGWRGSVRAADGDSGAGGAAGLAGAGHDPRDHRELHEDDAVPALAIGDLLSPLWQALQGVGTAQPDARHSLSTLLGSVLFPAPTPAQVHAVIYSSGWTARLAAATRLAGPTQLAPVLAAGLARGESPRQIAQALLPIVDGVRSTARRIARTEGMRVGHALNMEAHAALGDLVIGYEVHATLDQNTRPWHRARNGVIYYRDPGPGQKAYPYQCPQPPLEPEDPGERPPGTPQTAWNCRCWLAPRLRVG